MSEQQEHRVKNSNLVVMRRRVGLRQSELARLLGIPQSLLRDMESGGHAVTPQWEKRIREVIGKAQRSRPITPKVEVKSVITPDAEQRLGRAYDLLLERGSEIKQGQDKGKKFREYKVDQMLGNSNHCSQKESPITKQKISVGRPRVSVDFTIVLSLRDEQNLGWSRMAEAYRKLTGQYISRDTIKRRYLEAKHVINSGDSLRNPP